MTPTRLPAPAMPLLTPHDEYSMAHLIEKHIEFYKKDKKGDRRPVALDPVFVRHYMRWRDSKLPVVTAIVTSPLVLPSGTLLATRGLDRQRGIIFRLQPELVELLPKPEECTSAAVVDAMRFLTDEWLVDVATDYAGKCVLIAAALTILERAVLPERPAFFVTAGQRGGGKTTTLQMLFLAATGYRVPAAAWSPLEEERRKCLLSYLGEGVPAVCWDNIPRGSAISCPSIEKSLTTATYSDRVLGQTGTRTVPATTVNFFTGNNIAPRGDMASRSLQVRLAVDRSDPENRTFRHADPIEWTTDHRGNVLQALYTLLLGNPRLRATSRAVPETRFKMWWHLVGAAVEHAAKLHLDHVNALAIDANTICPPAKISFRGMFLDGEADEEQTSSLATVIDTMRSRWTGRFKASDVALFTGGASEAAIEFKAALEAASGKPLPIVTPPRSVGGSRQSRTRRCASTRRHTPCATSRTTRAARSLSAWWDDRELVGNPENFGNFSAGLPRAPLNFWGYIQMTRLKPKRLRETGQKVSEVLRVSDRHSRPKTGPITNSQQHQEHSVSVLAERLAEPPARTPSAS